MANCSKESRTSPNAMPSFKLHTIWLRTNAVNTNGAAAKVRKLAGLEQRYVLAYYTILYYTILYYTILYYTILYYIILYYTILHYTTLYYDTLYYTIPYYTMLYYTMLYYTILYAGEYTSNGSAKKVAVNKNMTSAVTPLVLTPFVPFRTRVLSPLFSEFRDVVFEDVVFDNNIFSLTLYLDST